MNLTLEQIYLYLPHDLKFVNIQDPTKLKSLDAISYESNASDYIVPSFTLKEVGHAVERPLAKSSYKPVLRPLSAYKELLGIDMMALGCDLNVEMEINDLANLNKSLSQMSWSAMKVMCEYHIDFNRLLDHDGLAVNMHELNQIMINN